MNHDHSNGMGKHMLIMLACCLVPIALIVAVSVFGLSLGGLTPFVPYALVLLCPLMMIFMMRGMMQGEGADHSQHHRGDPSTSSTEQALGRVDAPRTAPAPRIASNAMGAVARSVPRQIASNVIDQDPVLTRSVSKDHLGDLTVPIPKGGSDDRTS